MDSSELQKLNLKIPEINKKLEKLELSKNRVIKCLLGVTGSGKSTLINYLLGGEMKYEKKLGRFHINSKENFSLPKIGNSATSCTEMPELYDEYFDFAGFCDTKGITQQICNSYTNSRIFQRGSKIKILLLFEESSLSSGKGKNLVETANILSQIFRGDFTNLLHSILFVCTKVNTEEYKEKDIVDLCQQILSGNQNLDNDAKLMIKSMIQLKRIVLFPKPNQIEEHQSISKIKLAIEKLPPCVLNNPEKISLSPEAQLHVQGLQRGLKENLNKITDQLIQEIEQRFAKQQYTTLKEVNYSLLKLDEAKNYLVQIKKKGLEESLKFLYSRLQISQKLIQKINICVQKLNFCYELLKEKQFQFSCFESLEKYLSKLQSQIEKKGVEIENEIEMKKKKEFHYQQIEERNKEFEKKIKELEEQKQKEIELKEQQQRKAKQMQSKSGFFQAQMRRSNLINLALVSKLDKMQQNRSACTIM